MALPNGIVLVLRWLAIALIVTAFLVFTWSTFSAVDLYWYAAPWSTGSTWTLSYKAMEGRYEDAGATIGTLEYGSTALSVLCMFGSTLAAALGTFALRALRRTRKAAGSSRGGASLFDSIWHRIKRVLLYELPPRKMWLWWCGGMTVLDASLLLALCALGAIWTEQLTIGYFRYLDNLVDYGTFDTYYEELDLYWAKVEAVGNRTGWLPLAGALVLFYPLPRSSFLQELFGVDFSYLIKYHRWFGHFTMIGTAVHGAVYYVSWGHHSRFAEQFRLWQIYSISNLAGNLSFIFGIILWVSSFQYVRRHFFEWFYKLHIIGFLGFYIFGFMHYNGLFYYSAPGFLLYMLDVTFRLAQWMNVSVITGSLMSKDILALQLSFDPSTHLKPNSFVFLSVPDASRSQWHPFTLSIVQNSSDGKRPAQATIYVKPYARWSQAVVRRIAEKGTALVKIDGPYGGTSDIIEGSCDMAIIFAGGIGVTPMLGVLSAMREQRMLANSNGQGHRPRPQKVLFIWACRSSQEFDLLDDELLAEARRPDSWLDVQLYCTQDEDKLNGKATGFPVNGHAKEAMVQLQQASEDPAGAVPIDTVADFQRPGLKLASPFFLKPGLLHGYGIGYGLWSLVHVLCFFGAYFGKLMADPYYVIHNASDPNGCPYWLYNTVMLIGMTVGSMGLPALVIFPVFLWKHHAAQKRARDMRVDAAGMLPSWQGKGQKDAEAGPRAAFHYGRPNIRAVLKNVQMNCAGLSDIHVCAAGPPSMVDDVKSACVDLTSVFSAGPRFTYEIDSFAL